MPAIFVVDDDEGQRQSLRRLLEFEQLKVETCADTDSFLTRADAQRAACIIFDVHSGGPSGPEVMDRLHARLPSPQVIFLSGQADVQMAVRAMKAGAVDFIEKPVDQQALLCAVRKALRTDSLERERRAQEDVFRECLASLTPRERQILGLITTGRSNRLIGEQLGISCRTVEAHRAKLMRKMRATSLADLLQRAASYNVMPAAMDGGAIHQGPVAAVAP